MPYCANCGNEVEKEHYYCGQCGKPLTDEVGRSEDDHHMYSTSFRDGFLSPRSLQYVNNVRDGEQEWADDSPGFANLSRDVNGAFRDFGYLAVLEETTLAPVILEGINEGDVSTTNLSDLTTTELDELGILIGLLRLPALYDRTFDTEWASELREILDELLDELDSDEVSSDS